MKTKNLLFLLIVFCFSKSFSQEDFKIPDYEQIKKEITDKSSDYYYPKLMERLTVADTTLTLEDYRHLYYGYVFDSKYSAYWRSPDQEKLQKYYSQQNLDPGDYDKVIKLLNHSISEFPFDLRQLNFLTYVYHLKGDEEASKKTSYKFHGIVNAILSTGNGRKCETGFHVISVSHEYVILNLFEVQSESQSLIGHCDFLSFEKGKYKIDGLYFDIQKMMESELKALGGK